MEEDCLHYGGYFGEDQNDSGDLIDKIKSWRFARRPATSASTPACAGEYNYLWDELTAAAWLDPSLITKKETRYMDVDLDRGADYGNILTWTDRDKPKIDVQPVEIQVDLDTEKFYKMFVDLLKAPTPAKY